MDTVTLSDITFERRLIDHDRVTSVGAYHLGRRIGWITTGHGDLFRGPNGEPVIADLFVFKDYRRIGIATELLRVLRTLVPDVMHSPQRTTKGQAWALSTGDKLPPWRPMADWG